MTTEQRRLALRHMEASPFPVLFSAGAQTRTKRVAARCERAHHYLKSVLEFDPTLLLLVLSRGLGGVRRCPNLRHAAFRRRGNAYSGSGDGRFLPKHRPNAR